VTAADGRSAVSAGEVETLRREWARHEAVMRAIGDPASPEGAIARRAFERLTDIVAELQLDPSIVELAHQASDSGVIKGFLRVFKSPCWCCWRTAAWPVPSRVPTVGAP